MVITAFIILEMNICSPYRFLFRFCNCKNKLLSNFHFCENLCHSQFAMENRSVEKSIQNKLESRFSPVHLKVINESFMHNVPKGSETHFKVLVVSQEFENMPLLKRHRLVNSVLEEDLKNEVHALSIVAKAPSQWNQNEEVEGSPKCLGGFEK